MIAIKFWSANSATASSKNWTSLRRFKKQVATRTNIRGTQELRWEWAKATAETERLLPLWALSKLSKEGH
jgi:hypothetical protein